MTAVGAHAPVIDRTVVAAPSGDAPFPGGPSSVPAAVVLVVDGAAPFTDGPDRPAVLERLSKGLQDLGVQVAVVVVDRRPVVASPSARLSSSGIDLHRLPARAWVQAAAGLVGDGGRDRAGREHRPQPAPVVHVLHPSLLRGGARLARRAGGPLVVDVGDGAAARALVEDRLIRWHLRVAKPVVAVPDDDVRALLPSGVPTAVVRGGTVSATPRAVHDLARLYRQVGGGGDRPRFLAVNARFTARPTTGVERVAGNIASHMQGPRALFVPSRRWARGPLGHLWEQVVLPLRVLPYRTWVWSPCNFGPVLRRRQVVSVYDVAPVDHPEWFSPGYRRWFRVCVGQLYRRVRVVVVSTPFTRQRVADAFGPTRATVAIVPGGVGPASTAVPPPPRLAADGGGAGGGASCREGLDGPFVCFVGSLEPRKNLDVLVEAMTIVQRTLECPLVVVGPTASTRVFASGGGPTASPPWVRWAGRVDDATLEDLLRRSACLAYPSRYEGFGLPPLEAMAVGTLVVASDIPPLRQTCGDAARYVDPDDAESVAAGLVETVLLDEGARERRRAQGEERVQHFSWASAAEALEEVVWPST